MRFCGRSACAETLGAPVGGIGYVWPMLKRLWLRLFDRHVAADADRLIRAHGARALQVAEHSARAAREEGVGHWSRVAREIARQTRRRAF